MADKQGGGSQIRVHRATDGGHPVCGMLAIGRRGVAVTDDEDKVTCARCRRMGRLVEFVRRRRSALEMRELGGRTGRAWPA
ncbi:MAG: hypothetical protein U1E23_00975 [Reyranellaceae bacterium]